MSCGNGASVYNNGCGAGICGCGCGGFSGCLNQAPIYNYGPVCPPQYPYPYPITQTVQAGGIVVQSSWNIPTADGSIVNVTIPGIRNLTPGTYLQSSVWGKFLITAFNAATYVATLSNPGFATNVAAGSLVPANTVFTSAQLTFARGSWAPTLTASGSMTVTSQVIREAVYQVSEGEFFFDLTVGFTVGGSVSTTINIPLPFDVVTGNSTYANYLCTAVDGNGTNTTGAWKAVSGTPGHLAVGRSPLGAGNWTAGASGLISIQGKVDLL